jgi:hypothetical protein
MEFISRRWLLTVPVILGGAVAALLVVLRAFGLLNADAEGADRLTAVLTFFGVLVTASVTLIGLAISGQAERRLERTHQDEQQRLRLDAAMKAGALLDRRDGRVPEPASVASGLLALTQLEQAELAVALLVDLWTKETENKVSTETAILVIKAALLSDQPSAQLVASELLCRKAKTLDATHSLHWPSSIDGRWLPGLGNRSKLLLVDGLVQMTLTSEPTENALRSTAVRLYGISDGDPDKRVKRCVGRLINSLLPALKGLGYSDFLQGQRLVTLAELEAATRFIMENPDGMLERIVQKRTKDLAAWSAQCKTILMRPGSLATTAG